MLSAIDFGKYFLTQYFNRRDVDAAASCCADDVIWITPNEIRHFRSGKSVRDFIVSSLEEDQETYSVDYAATLSVPDLDTAGIVVFEINLIPRHKDSSVSLRCSLGLRRGRESFELVFIGMSRKYQRTDMEQIRTFADALPCGVMTLAAVRGETRLMYASAFFYERLGYGEADFYQKVETNPFYMMPFEEQKRMQTLVAEMSALVRPRPLSMQVTLLGADGSEQVPCQMTIAAAYKEGEQTILYLLFDEITDLVTEFGRKQRRQERQLREQLEQGERFGNPVPDGSCSGDVEQMIAEIRRDAEKRIAAVQIEANVHVEEAHRLANEEADAAERLIRAKLEEAAGERDAAVERARREVSSRYAAAWKKEKARYTQEKASLEEEIARLRESAETMQQEQERGGQERAGLEERLESLEQASRQEKEEIARLQEELRQKEEEQKALGRKAGEQETALETAKRECAEARGNAQSREKELSDVIARQQTELKNQQLAMQRKEVDTSALIKEKDKSLRRMESLLQGQLQSVRSIAGAAGSERKPEELRRQMARIAGITDSLPAMVGDLTAIAMFSPGERREYTEAFRLSECLELVRGVIRPRCREKGIIFSVESDPGMQDRVSGSKSGLELAFLSILENAVDHTLSGGQITLKASAEKAVRGKAYYSFTVTDTGEGIAEDRLSGLFDNPQSELSIARKAIASMGGSIQARSREGQGAVFEIRVNLSVTSST